MSIPGTKVWVESQARSAQSPIPCSPLLWAHGSLQGGSLQPSVLSLVDYHLNLCFSSFLPLFKI